jgi:hypothetical protein
LKEEITMLKKSSLVLSLIFTVIMLLAACTPSVGPIATLPAAATTAAVQPTTVPTVRTVPVQPTTVPILPTTGINPCGTTNGNGQVVSVGNNEFTLRRDDDGSDQIVHLANGAMIQTSTGFIALSDLRIGDRVTLVGGPNPDGSFTVDFVAVCN